MSWTGDLVILCEDASVGTLGVDIFVGSKANIPILASGEATLTITDTSGSGPERTQNRTITPAYIRPAAQFLTRAGTSAQAREKAQAAYDAVVGIRNSLIWDTGYVSSGWYREINPLQEPFDAGVDDRKQARYSFNVIAVKRP
jgi:hypothetical protein